MDAISGGRGGTLLPLPRGGKSARWSGRARGPGKNPPEETMLGLLVRQDFPGA